MWEFFENLDEMVYASDVKTYELVYMNHKLRHALGYGNHRQYVGKPCYQILQGADRPCPFCTNCQLQEGEFITWVHENPILNKRVLLKDTLFKQGEKSYRIEIAIDANTETACKTPYYYTRTETVLNGCIHRIFSTANAEESIHKMLAYIGETFVCDRAYIFELDDSQTACNTYEWCADGIAPQKDVLQNVSVGAIDWWLALFADHQVTVIPDLEEIRTKYPESYAVLKPQGIRSLAAGPITENGKITGFIGVDNPDENMMPVIESFLDVIGYFTATLIQRREMLFRLNHLSYHDQLTGAFNRHALMEQYRNLSLQSVGVIYCDVTGLKKVNDQLGHEAGDRLLCRCCALLREAVDTDQIYRTGGDEFVVLCPDCSEQEFQDVVFKLQRKIGENDCHIALGHIWSDNQPLNLEKLIAEADQVMYRDKRNYYQTCRLRPGSERHTENGDACARKERSKTETPLQAFLDMTDFDAESLIQSVAVDNDSSYFYLGNMQKDLFYISDNMRDDFGFQSNLVHGLLHLWGKRISTPEYQDLYWQDISKMLREKKSVHDLRYRVRDARGNSQWVRCYGILKWNEDKTKPLFFSGRVTHQDTKFVVDPVTGFLREPASFQQLNELKDRGEKTWILGFSLNGLTEVNSTRGREYGDRLIQKVANALLENLSWQMTFYRLEGARCMAVLNPVCMQDNPESLVEQIRAIVKACYEGKDISVQKVCSFGLIEYPNEDLSSEDVVDSLLALIRVARQNASLSYVDYSQRNVEQAKQISNMALALSQDVAHNMKHFRIVVQPVVSAGDCTAVGGEVLLRWSFEGKDVSPAIFIPMLEKDGLIHAVGRWVFEQAVSTCTRIHSYDPAFYLTFNVSLQQLSDPLLLPFMRQTLEKYGLKGSSLVAELTESFLDEQPESLARFVRECQEMGMYIALDDFGSGYSSLRMLLRYPSSIIKLDRSLIGEMLESEEKMNFIRSIVFSCHQFGKTVCMEGVENAEQNELILGSGCDMIQGYYYYRPMELGDVYRLISQKQPEMD